MIYNESKAKPFYPPNKLEVPHNLLSDEERNRRWSKVRSAMGEQGLSCLIVDAVGFPGMSYGRYLTNAVPESSYVVFPIEGDVTEVIYMRPPIEFIRKMSWAQDIRLGAWAHPNFTWAKVAADRVKELGYENKKIGVVGAPGAFYAGWISYDNYVGLQRELSKAKLVPATQLLDDIRIIKSDEEIALIRKAAEITDKAIEVMAKLAKPGAKESDIYAHMVEKILEEGSEYPMVFLMSSGPDVHQAIHYPQHRLIRKGDVILTETFARYGGYHAHPQQPVFVGEPSTEYEKFLEACLESIAAGLKVLRPGKTFADVTEAMGEPILRRGFFHDHPAYHGLGVCNLEEPVSIFMGGLEGFERYTEELLAPLSKIKVQPNMVVALEPMAGSGTKALHIGPTVRTTSDGPEILTRYGRDVIRA